VCVCEPAAASTHDDADDTRNERHRLLTDNTATAHSDVAETIPLARLDQPDVDQQTEAIPSPAGTLSAVNVKTMKMKMVRAVDYR